MSIQSLNENYNYNIDVQIKDFEKLGELTPGHKLMIYQDSQGPHLSILLGNSTYFLGKYMQAAEQKAYGKIYGPNDHQAIFKHIKEVDVKISEHLSKFAEMID